ncbi:MAG: hypothetical protein H7287_10260 [Thermoleophilia bacterium]|nr:hypothetical protein [Thermoleophilia bacterium]
MQLAATPNAAPHSNLATLIPRSDVAAKLNLSVQDLFNMLHVNARDAYDAGLPLTPATIVRGINPTMVSGNFMVLIQAARSVAPEAEQHLAAAEHAVAGLTQLLLSAAEDHTSIVDPTQLSTQFLRPFNEQLALVSRAATHVAAGAFV